MKAIASRGTLSKVNIPEINKLYMGDRQELRLDNLTIEAKKINHDALVPIPIPEKSFLMFMICIIFILYKFLQY